MSEEGFIYSEQSEDYSKKLPAWFVRRMLADNWFFGLLTVTGQVICIACINRITTAEDGTIWLDCEWLDERTRSGWNDKNYLYAPTSRIDISINASHIIAAFEIADT